MDREAQGWEVQWKEKVYAQKLGTQIRPESKVGLNWMIE